MVERLPCASAVLFICCSLMACGAQTSESPAPSAKPSSSGQASSEPGADAERTPAASEPTASEPTASEPDTPSTPSEPAPVPSADCNIKECFRAVECVEVCRGPVVESGCCPCPPGTRDVGTCLER
ncbi:MAG TPA: hypothetical protein VHM70_07915 [Polyangiaceae bacterium]|nr:hypothetical protein [Polyangiaceae bacterium]